MISNFYTDAYIWVIPTNKGFRSCLQSQDFPAGS